MKKFFDIIEEEFEEADSFASFIRYMYWNIIPYNMRPGQLLYRLKCFCWYRYTTIKPRQLDHTWCDRAELMPYMMFEILSQFLEKECSPGIVDWEASDHGIMYGGHSRNVQDVMWHLYHWWHKVYLVKNEHEYGQWSEYTQKHTLKLSTFDAIWNPEYISDEHKRHAGMLFKRAMKKEVALTKELNENLKYIVDLIPYLWT